MPKIIGFEKREYTNKEGKRVEGYNMYTVYQSSRVVGSATGKEWLTVDRYTDLVSLADGDVNRVLGVDVDILFNRYGNVEVVRLAPKPAK